MIGMFFSSYRQNPLHDEWQSGSELTTYENVHTEKYVLELDGLHTGFLHVSFYTQLIF